MPGELSQISANKTAINEKRTAIKGSDFYMAAYYWSSREQNSSYEYVVLLSNGNIYECDNKSMYRNVLGFLALEV